MESKTQRAKLIRDNGQPIRIYRDLSGLWPNGRRKILSIFILALVIFLGTEGTILKESGPTGSKSFRLGLVGSGWTCFSPKTVHRNKDSFPTPAKNRLSLPLPEFTSEKDSIYKQEEITVALIDSGLGGLSIMAEAANRLEKGRFYRRVNLVFFNALFSKEGGYNALPTRQARLEMFDRVLGSLKERINPNLILIACNTLSTLYPATRFSQTTDTPVLDIIRPGVELLAAQLRKQPEALAIIFATPITISEDTHRQQLLKQGFAPNRLVVQACPELEVYIEKDPQGEETGLLISGFIEEALQKIPSPPPPLIFSLNCTHYGYSLPLWEKAAQENPWPSLAIVNPNSGLIDLWLKPSLKPRFKQTEIKARCFSRVEIEAEKRQKISFYLSPISPLTAEALRHYTLDPKLF